VQPSSNRDLRHSQNCLHSNVLIDRLLDASSIRTGDLVMDLGAGTGIISHRLASRGCRVIAVETDPDLVTTLRRKFASNPEVRVCQTDILRMRLPREPYKVFANIPFDMTAHIFHHLTRAPLPPDDAYLVVQREAYQRFAGEPITTLVAVLLFPWFETSLVHQFRRTDFVPAPRVDVVMLRLRKRGPPLVALEHTQLFRDFVIHTFTTRNATVLQVLSQLIGRRRARRLLGQLGVNAREPSRVPPSLWLRLFHAVLAGAPHELSLRVAHAEHRLRAQQRRLRKLHRTRWSRLRPPPRLTPYRSYACVPFVSDYRSGV
jgi:23S rRNA (adenine-N6)-dimethyltransferase